MCNCISICNAYEPGQRQHVYVHGLSLLASILQHLDLSAKTHSHEAIWSAVLADFARNELDGIHGLLCETTRKQSEEFLSGLTLMADLRLVKNSRKLRSEGDELKDVPPVAGHHVHRLLRGHREASSRCTRR